MGLLLIGSFKNSKLFTREEGSEFFFFLKLTKIV